MSYDALISDLDGDGNNDIFIAGQNRENVVWFENPKH
jgi:hypothetical protein